MLDISGHLDMQWNVSEAKQRFSSDATVLTPLRFFPPLLAWLPSLIGR